MAIIYWAVYPSGQADPVAADIVAGTVANGFHGNDTAPVTTQTFQGAAITGLAASTEYKLASVWDDGTNASNVSISAPFTTASAGADVEGTGGLVFGSINFTTAAGQVIDPVEGTGTFTLSSGLSMGGSGESAGIDGTSGTMVLGTFSIAGSGGTTEGIEGAGTLSFSGVAFTAAGTASDAADATGTMSVGSFSFVGSGEVSIAGSSAGMQLGTFSMPSNAGTASTGPAGSGAMALGGFTLSGLSEIVTAVLGVRVDLFSGAVSQNSITGIHALWWDTEDPTGVPVYETTTASTNGSGQLELDLNGVTALTEGDTGFLLLWKPNNATPEDSPAFAGRIDVTSIA